MEKLLVLDDEALICKSLEELFEEDYEVFTTGNAATALRLVEEHDIAVILCDELMPGVNGHEFLRRVKRFSRATRIMMSGYADLSALIEAINRGQIFAYVAKPWEPLELKATVGAAAVHFRLVKEVERERGLMHALMENIPDAIYFKDCQSRFTRVNQACARLLGAKDPEECIGKSDADYFDSEYALRFRLEEEEMMRSGRPEVNRIQHIQNLQGGLGWMSTNKVPMFDRSDRVSGIAGITRDVTALKDSEELKAAEATLRDSEARCRELADALPQIIWTASPDGNRDYFNRRWCEYTGMAYKESEGWGWRQAMHPNDVQRSTDRWTESLATGEGHEVEYRLKRAADGVYRWHLGRAVPVFDSRHQIVRWVGTCTDIDDYKHAEREVLKLKESLEARVHLRTAELHDREQLLRSLVDGIEDYAILLLDNEGNIIVWSGSAKRPKGCDTAEILGKHFSCFYTEEDILRHHPEELLGTAAAQGKCEEEGLWVRRDGSCFRANVLITALYDEAGGVRGFSKVIRNLTNRQQAEEQLQPVET